MKKRFQVFISSTFKDLEKEREVIANTLLEKNCIPVGMEWFSAMDEEKFEYIKKVIDDSDYYVLLLGGRYGTLAADGKSYTEKEFDYAVEQGKKVIVLVQNNPEMTESDIKQLSNYEDFKSKAMGNRMVKFWNKPEELSGHLAISLDNYINKFPAQGWIRCDPSSCDQKLPFTEMNSKIASLGLETVETIHIMASGTTSYLTAVRTLVKMNVEKKPIHIYIYFRIGSELERKNIMKGATNNLWNTLKRDYPHINYHFLGISDFHVSFRGIVINKSIGLIGVYVRENNDTIGSFEDLIYVDRTTDSGDYLIKFFLKCFDKQTEYPTLKDCLEQYSL